MILPYDTILLPLLIIGMVVYYGMKDIGSSPKKSMSHEEFVKWFREKEIERSPENIRYQKWLYEHRQE